MRIAVVVKSGELSAVAAKLSALGAENVNVKQLLNQIFCDIDSDKVGLVSQIPGVSVKEVQGVRLIKPMQAVKVPALVTAQQAGLLLSDIFGPLRLSYLPELDGAGMTVALLDSGVHATHEALLNKVVYSVNFSSDTDTEDNFNHGTSTAFVIAGLVEGKVGVDVVRSGVAPGVKLMNIKVLNTTGVGTDEDVINGVEEVCRLVLAAQNAGLSELDDMYPNAINLSLGTEDDGDPENALRVACRTAINTYGLEIIAAAGNEGPTLSTIMIPAVDPLVIAVGGLNSWEFTAWDFSSRGPTKEGTIKPDLMAWAESIEMASAESNIDYVVKSGTSFSTPIITGVDAILWDLTRRVYGPSARIRMIEWLQYAKAYCIKPADAPVDKDNTYGYGMPAVGSMVQQVQKQATGGGAGISIESMMPMMLMMGMMGMMVKMFK